MKYKNMATNICRKVMEKCYQKSAEVRFRTIDLNRYVLLLNIFGFLITQHNNDVILIFEREGYENDK